jgi:hypothetical protein
VYPNHVEVVERIFAGVDRDGSATELRDGALDVDMSDRVVILRLRVG